MVSEMTDSSTVDRFEMWDGVSARHARLFGFSKSDRQGATRSCELSFNPPLLVDPSSTIFPIAIIVLRSLFTTSAPRHPHRAGHHERNLSFNRQAIAFQAHSIGIHLPTYPPFIAYRSPTSCRVLSDDLEEHVWK